MLVEKIIGNAKDIDLRDKEIDLIDIEWYEVDKKLLKKTSSKGKDIGIRLPSEVHLHHNDVLYMDDKEAVVLNISKSDAIVIKATSMEEMGKICYEIGNKHIALFIHDDEISVPYDEPLMKLLQKKGFKPEKARMKLINGLEHHHHEH